MTTFSVQTGPLAQAFMAACARLDAEGFAPALWQARATAWPRDAGVQAAIANRLGWVSALDFVAPHLPRLRAFADGVRSDGFSHVVLLGMGGSSLAPEVLKQVLGVAPGFPRFRMLDSVDPDEVRQALEPAATTLFLFASKSGSTIEPNSMAAEARRRVEAAGHTWGRRVVAITDNGTDLHARATRERFRDIFVNPSDIGGRYSALSFFGLVPASLIGADLDALIAGARAMESACRTTVTTQNPGLALGALMAAGAEGGRDKLTLIVPEALASLGLWVEQLVAESTGKRTSARTGARHVGVVPITGEAPGVRIGSDRLGVEVTLGQAEPDAATMRQFQSTGAPVARLEMAGAEAIAAEFFRWEVATAAAGWLLDINPFDEPNVSQAKQATRTLLDQYVATGELVAAGHTIAIDGVQIRMSAAASAVVGSEPRECLRALVHDGDYVAILPYLPPSHAGLGEALASLRHAIGVSTGCATMFGYGPRYLHSTGQLHKGGPNTGVFVLVTADGADDLAIPGEPFSFGVLESAQAIGDFLSLEAENRRAIHVHLPRRDPALVTRLVALLTGATAAQPA